MIRSLIICLLLAGCATDTSTCPPIVEYPKSVQNQAADEIEKMVADGNYPTVLRFLGDYKAERAQLRACWN